MSQNNGFTPTERRLLDVLKDGEGHLRAELRLCLSDELTSLGTLRVHIFSLRKKLRQRGEDVICTIDRGHRYRIIPLRFVSSGE